MGPENRQNRPSLRIHKDKQGITTLSVNGYKVLRGKPAGWALRGLFLASMGLGGVGCAQASGREATSSQPPGQVRAAEVPTSPAQIVELETPTKEPTEAPVAVLTATKEPTRVPPTATKPAPTPTEVKPTPTPEKVATKKELLAEVDNIISLVQNPDPEQAAKFNPETLKNLNILIISGPQNPKNPSPEYAAVSLKGVAAAIEEGNNSLAQERIKSLILSSNLSAPRRTALGPGDAVKWKKEEIDLYDPERRIVPLGHIFFGYSKFREPPISSLFKLHYWIGPVTATK